MTRFRSNLVHCIIFIWRLTSTAKDLKIIYVLLDGIGDLPHPDLNGLTPLESAITPNLNSLAKNGSMGQVISVGKGVAPQSDIAVFNMLGYNFKGEKYAGRGVIEIIGSAVDFKVGDLALRGNFATLGLNTEIIDRRAGRIIEKEEAKELCQYLERNIKFSDPEVSIKIIPTIAHRVIVRLRHNNIPLSAKITNTDPAYDRIDGIGISKTFVKDMQVKNCEAEDNSESSILSARMVNEFTEQCILLAKNHPVNLKRITENKKPMNIILLRDPGNNLPSLQPINEKYGIQVACVVDMPVELGIARTLGMEFFSAGGIDDYEIKAEETGRLLRKFDLVYVHLKGPDEYGHDGNAVGKKESIESIDRRFFGTLLKDPTLTNPTIIVSGDHSTPCIAKAHSDDPIPLLISGNLVKNDGSKRFTESYASHGTLGCLTGVDVLDVALRMIR